MATAVAARRRGDTYGGQCSHACRCWEAGASALLEAGRRGRGGAVGQEGIRWSGIVTAVVEAAQGEEAVGGLVAKRCAVAPRVAGARTASGWSGDQK